MYSTRFESWQRVWRNLARPHQLDELYESVVAAHAARHRAYHTLDHVQHCLTQLARFRALAEHRGEVALAIWFHDAVYSPWRSGDERRSAAWAVRELDARGASDHVSQRIERLILVTDHQLIPATADEQLIVDLDLIILGTPPESYRRYANAIRREHHWTPSRIYRRRRAHLLEQLLQREMIYRTEAVAERYEEQARKNLQRELDQLNRH